MPEDALTRLAQYERIFLETFCYGFVSEIRQGSLSFLTQEAPAMTRPRDQGKLMLCVLHSSGSG
jgi:hypothetical protein